MHSSKLLIILLSLLCLSNLRADDETWSKTIENVSSSIVSIKIDSPRAFDTEWKSSSQATGFIVDAENGIILTNRHVVNPGPVHAEALFLNNEEVELLPLYRDPVHDFGFFGYDPEKLEHMNPSALPLISSGAEVGQEIRVIGNDAGEKLSILTGIIARLDRSAPNYGRGNYNDFNTFYMQAASGTSGGSSGSPVINIKGEVVALNAGGNNSAASSYFLPLNRVIRALELISQKKPITRGTILTEFEFLPIDKLKRLGMSRTTESLLLDNEDKDNGLLVAKRIIKDSPVYNYLKSGDILTKINGNHITDYIDLADQLDGNVDQAISIEIERSGKKISFSVVVTDLFNVTPESYLTFGGAIINNLSYQQARHYNRKLEGAYIADPGYIFSRSGIPTGSVILEADGIAIRNLDDLELLISSLSDGEQMNVRYVRYSDPINEVLRSIEVDHKWFMSERCSLNKEDGFWPCRKIEEIKKFPRIQKKQSTKLIDYLDTRKNKISASLVHVNFDLPYPLAGIMEKHYYGTGVVVDNEKGLVIVDRNTVPISMGDVKLTFAGSLQIPARVEYIHPIHNIVLLSYDVDLIGNTPVQSAEFNVEKIDEGDEIWLFGLKSDHQLYTQKTNVSSIDPLMLPPSLSFRDTNIEVINLTNAPDEIVGVLSDENGRIRAMWTSFSYRSRGESYQMYRGINAELISDFIDSFEKEESLRSLELELNYIPLFAARKLGLNDDWISRFESQKETKQRMLVVKNVIAGSPMSNEIRSGDIILTINGSLIGSYRDYEVAIQEKNPRLEIWRDKERIEVSASTSELNGNSIDEAIFWAGAHIHKPHRALNQRGIESKGVYVAFNNYGSPATRYGLSAGLSIIEVDDTPISNLADFKESVRSKKFNDTIKLSTLSWNGSKNVITMKLNNRYWPAYEIKKNGYEWNRSVIE